MEYNRPENIVEEVKTVSGDQEVYVVHHDVRDDGLTVTISLALSEIGNVPPTELLPRFPEYADPDALDRLFRPRPNGELREGGPFHLTIEGYDISIFNTGRIEIRP
jgi:hypothetical protein